jgi:hypothetical protein
VAAANISPRPTQSTPGRVASELLIEIVLRCEAVMGGTCGWAGASNERVKVGQPTCNESDAGGVTPSRSLYSNTYSYIVYE